MLLPYPFLLKAAAMTKKAIRQVKVATVKRSRFFLRKGEIWKYGVTSKGQAGRYSDVFLIKNQVSYFVQFSGTFSECLKQEQILLFNYPYLPENLARNPADRLSRPPYNSIMR